MLSLSFIGEVKKWSVWHKDNEIHGYKVFKEREDKEMCQLRCLRAHSFFRLPKMECKVKMGGLHK